MVSTSARNAGGPWFDSWSRHDRFLYANSVYIYIGAGAEVCGFETYLRQFSTSLFLYFIIYIYIYITRSI